jgi:predicted O-methyltransferase YrrM
MGITISEIEKQVIEAGSDHLRTFGGEKEGGAELQQVPIEIASCIHRIMESGESIESYLEIGAAAGGSVFLINKFFKPKKIVLVDDNGHPKFKQRAEILKGVDRVEIIGNSQLSDTIQTVYATGKEFDLLLIDGDHSYDGSLSDVANYTPLVRPGGFIMMHDIAYEPAFGVKQVFSEMKHKTNPDPNDVFDFIGEYVAETGPKCGIGLFQKL